jgi:short-subunit dehydrogenase
MQGVADKIKNLYNVETKILVFDFSTLVDIDDVDRMDSLLDSIQEDVCILVNNVGKANANQFHKQDYDILYTMLRVNINSQMFMSHYFIPKFLERFNTQGNRSAIINIASISALNPSPSTIVYGASKAFNRILSLGMTKEYPKEIDVLTVDPRSVKSNMNSGRYLFTVTADQHAKSVVDQLGWELETQGHYVHDFEDTVTHIWPLNSIVHAINFKRRQDFLRERDLKEQ